METVEVLVRMPKSEYEELQGNYVWWGRHGEYIKKGTVLPKGHDNLIDKGQLLRNVRKKAQEYDEPWKTNLGSVVEYFVAGCDVIIGEDWSDTDGNS